MCPRKHSDLTPVSDSHRDDDIPSRPSPGHSPFHSPDLKAIAKRQSFLPPLLLAPDSPIKTNVKKALPQQSKSAPSSPVIKGQLFSQVKKSHFVPPLNIDNANDETGQILKSILEKKKISLSMLEEMHAVQYKIYLTVCDDKSVSTDARLELVNEELDVMKAINLRIKEKKNQIEEIELEMSSTALKQGGKP